MYELGVARCQPKVRTEYPYSIFTHRDRHPKIIRTVKRDGSNKIDQMQDDRFNFAGKHIAQVGQNLLTYACRSDPLKVAKYKYPASKKSMVKSELASLDRILDDFAVVPTLLGSVLLCGGMNKRTNQLSAEAHL